MSLRPPPSSCGAVMRMIWKTIDAPPRHWKSKAKALIVLDHLVKNGAERIVADAQQHIHDISYLHEFKYVDSGIEHGTGGECFSSCFRLAGLGVLECCNPRRHVSREPRAASTSHMYAMCRDRSMQKLACDAAEYTTPRMPTLHPTR